MCEVAQLVKNVFLFYEAWRSETVLRRESENSTSLLKFIFPWDQFQQHLCVDLPSFISSPFLLHAALVSRFCVWSSISGWWRRRIICMNLLYSNIYPTRCNVTQFILSGNCSTCLGWYHHPSSGAHTTIYSIWYLSYRNCYRGRVGTALQFQLFHDSGR